MHVILHIGLPKTGTTFLQQQLAYHRDSLAADGIYLPRAATLDWARSCTGESLCGRMTCEQNNHLMLAWALQPERWGQFPEPVQRLLPNVWNELKQELAECGAASCLITAENLSWELAEKQQVHRVGEHLAGHDVSVVCCMREPRAFIASMYGHMLVMDRGPYSIEQFIAEFYPRWTVEFQRALWSKVFGDGCFQEIAYESIGGPEMLRRFLAAALPGHPAALRDYPQMPATDPHRSVSPRFQRLLEELHANEIESEPFKSLYDALPESYVPLEKRLVTPADIDAAVARHHAVTRQASPVELQSSSQALEIVTQDLIAVRELLVERTARLEQAIAERDRLANELRGLRAVPAVGSVEDIGQSTEPTSRC
jgi:hypothetical protein